MKHSSDWYNAIAHVDADCFFASCELIRRPDLKGEPVCVLSSQDACVVAKTYDAKAAGITTGMPVWEAKKLLPTAHFLSADFHFYGQISAKMFSILHRYSPDIESYSIDEGFIDMNGIRSMWRMSFRELADHIRQSVYVEVGITVSVGISTTRILAKVASEMNKPNGSTVIPGRRIARFLHDIPIGSVPGIGSNRRQLLSKQRINTAYDFCSTSKERIDNILGKAGVDLWQELNGQPVFRLELHPPQPKSISRTASLGQVTRDGALIHQHLIFHATRITTELVRQQLTTSAITVFLRLKSFEAVNRSVTISATCDFSRINSIVITLFNQLFEPGHEYRACGIVAHKLHNNPLQGELFNNVADTGKQLELVRVINTINRKYGAQTIKATAALQKSRQPRRFVYPVLNAVGGKLSGGR